MDALSRLEEITFSVCRQAHFADVVSSLIPYYARIHACSVVYCTSVQTPLLSKALTNISH